jgi:hypothetical protein
MKENVVVRKERQWHYLKKGIPRREADGAGHIGSYPTLTSYLARNASNQSFLIGYVMFVAIITAGRLLKLK